MEKASKRLRILAIFTFFLSPLFSWGSVIATDETAVFASLSRMIWYSGSARRIFIAMLGLFIPMLIAFEFEKLTREHENITLIRLSCSKAMVPASLGDRAVGINADMAQSIEDIAKILL